MDRVTLKYGPVGDPTSTDPFERAQASAPWGWHVEGQITHGRHMSASGPNAQGAHVWAYTWHAPSDEAMVDELIVRMHEQAISDVSGPSSNA